MPGLLDRAARRRPEGINPGCESRGERLVSWLTLTSFAGVILWIAASIFIWPSLTSLGSMLVPVVVFAVGATWRIASLLDFPAARLWPRITACAWSAGTRLGHFRRWDMPRVRSRVRARAGPGVLEVDAGSGVAGLGLWKYPVVVSAEPEIAHDRTMFGMIRAFLHWNSPPPP